MKQANTKTTVVAGLVLLAIALPAMAQERRQPDRRQDDRQPSHQQDGRGGGPGARVLGAAGRALHELELSEAQQARIRDIVRSSMEGKIGLLARSVQEARHALEIAVWDLGTTESDMVEASGDLAEQSEALERARHRLALEVLGVLTGSQRLAFAQAIRQAPPERGRSGGRSSPGGPGGGGPRNPAR